MIEYYGAAPVSVGNSIQVRQDSIFTSLIALVVIMLLLFLFFKRLLVILYILLPVAFGALFSLTLIYFLKGEISAIALGAGSIVLGIAINYSLHFSHTTNTNVLYKSHQRPHRSNAHWLYHHRWRFLSLQFTKSQALHDFGLFAGFSLIGAVLFQLLYCPIC